MRIKESGKSALGYRAEKYFLDRNQVLIIEDYTRNFRLFFFPSYKVMLMEMRGDMGNEDLTLYYTIMIFNESPP